VGQPDVGRRETGTRDVLTVSPARLMCAIVHTPPRAVRLKPRCDHQHESGRAEVYVQAFPSGGQRWKASAAGGSDPKWRRDGKELFYIISASKGNSWRCR
jgi:hypothetical protein